MRWKACRPPTRHSRWSKRALALPKRPSCAPGTLWSPWTASRWPPLTPTPTPFSTRPRSSSHCGGTGKSTCARWKPPRWSRTSGRALPTTRARSSRTPFWRSSCTRPRCPARATLRGSMPAPRPTCGRSPRAPLSLLSTASPSQTWPLPWRSSDSTPPTTLSASASAR